MSRKSRFKSATIDNDTGRVVSDALGSLRALPTDAVKFNSPGAPQSSLIMLSGKYVDGDGIVYDADGTVNEAATSAWARDSVTQQRAEAGGYAPDPIFQKADSVQQNSAADANAIGIDAFFSNIYSTVQELPQDAANVAKTVGAGAWTIGKLIAFGFGVVIALEVMQHVPHGKQQVRARVKHYRKRAARAISRRIAGD